MSNRDFVLARMAIVLTTVDDMRDDAKEIVGLFIDPDNDAAGVTRSDLLEGLEVGAQGILNQVQAARDALEGMNVDELREPEDEYDTGGPDEEPADEVRGDVDPEAHDPEPESPAA